MNKVVVADFKFDNKNGTSIEGKLFFPFVDGVIYKPIRAIITCGKFDLTHRRNKGAGAKKHRKFKDEMISNHCLIENGSFFAIVKEQFELFSNKPTGLVDFTSKLSGFNTNNQANFFLIHQFKGFYKPPKAAKLFQNLKAAKKFHYGNEITLEQAYKSNPKYFEDLSALYELNIKTASSNKLEEKNG